MILRKEKYREGYGFIDYIVFNKIIGDILSLYVVNICVFGWNYL